MASTSMVSSKPGFSQDSPAVLASTRHKNCHHLRQRQSATNTPSASTSKRREHHQIPMDLPLMRRTSNHHTEIAIRAILEILKTHHLCDLKTHHLHQQQIAMNTIKSHGPNQHEKHQNTTNLPNNQTTERSAKNETIKSPQTCKEFDHRCLA